MRMRYLTGVLAVTAAVSFLPAPAVAYPVSFPGCGSVIGPHLTTGCQMRGAWHDGDAAGASAKTPVVVGRRDTASARALVPLNANLEGGNLTYAVRFAAKLPAGHGSIAESLRVKVWLADDQNQNATSLRAVNLSVDSAGWGYITVEAPGANVGYQPHYIYARFAALGSLFGGGGIDDPTLVRVEDVQFVIYPTDR